MSTWPKGVPTCRGGRNENSMGAPGDTHLAHPANLRFTWKNKRWSFTVSKKAEDLVQKNVQTMENDWLCGGNRKESGALFWKVQQGRGLSSAAVTGQLLRWQELLFTGLKEPQSISSQKAHYTVMFILKADFLSYCYLVLGIFLVLGYCLRFCFYFYFYDDKNKVLMQLW